jgi:hypothetical protein
MHRSRDYGHMHLHSSENASWRKPVSPYLACNGLVHISTKPSICVDRLLPHLRRDRHQLLDVSLNREKRPARQRRTLVDGIKMDRLLQQLRTNAFIGIIDPRYHSQYLSEEPLQESGSINELMNRRSFAYVSKKRESSHFKSALKKDKSTSTVAAQKLIHVQPLAKFESVTDDEKMGPPSDPSLSL